MARPLTSGEREEYGHKAYDLSLRGVSQRKIGSELGLNHRTIGSLLKEQIKHRRLERRDSVNSLLDQYDLCLGEAWQRLQAIPKHSASPGVAGLINAANSLLRSKVDLLGLQPPKKSQSWVHHTSTDALEKLSQAQLEEYYALLERLFPDRDGGELKDDEGSAEVVRELEPYRQERR
jgi:hypothetical protein